MFVPIHDHNRLRRITFQKATVTLIAANCLAYALQIWLGDASARDMHLNAGITPSSLLDASDLGASYLYIPPWLTPITYMFLHGNLLHLVPNMLFLWVFGDNVEDAVGHGRFILFYLICGVAAGLAHAILYPLSDIPLIGASGAISGVFAAYVLLYPKVRVWIIPLPFIPLRFPIYWVVLAWLAYQFFFIATAADVETAWWAHIGGFFAGAILIIFMRQPGVPLFGPKFKPTPDDQEETPHYGT